jgi:hypothetical protein
MKNYNHNSLEPTYLFHVTQNISRKELKAKEFFWSPKNKGENRGLREPTIKRICCAKSVIGCLVALGCCLNPQKDIFVLRTKNKVHYMNIKKHHVLDSPITGEVWRLKKTKFKIHAKINIKDLPAQLFNMCVGSVFDFEDQKSMIKTLKNKGIHLYENKNRNKL